MLEEILNVCRADRPLTHCITNYVTANDCANLLLAAGASPIMADDPMEAHEIARTAHALLLNLGTPNPNKLSAMLSAGKAANQAGKPVVFDPVGAGVSLFRQDASHRLLNEVSVSVIRANASEVQSLLQPVCACRGVDVDEGLISASDHLERAKTLALRTRSVVLLTGETDLVTDGVTSYRVSGGNAIMKSVTGGGCQLSALTAAFCGVLKNNPLQAALASSCAMRLCAEIACARMTSADGNASCRNYVIDAMYRLTGLQLKKGAHYEII